MAQRDIRSIALANLLLNPENPRYEPVTSQREALALIVHDQKMKLVNLAQDIITRGLNPTELPIVTPSEEGNEGNTFIVLTFRVNFERVSSCHKVKG